MPYRPSTKLVVVAVTALAAIPVLLVSLFPVQLYGSLDAVHYIAFHSCCEWFSIIISLSIFGFGWYGFDNSKDRHALFLACAFLAIGLTDALHTLSYPGMPAFITPSSTNKASQLWIAARLLSAVGFLGSAFVYSKSESRWLSKWALLAIALIMPAVIFIAITFFPSYVPATFVEGVGLTPFKKSTEYVIICLLVLAVAAHWKRMAITGARSLDYHFVAAFALSAVSEGCFTVYQSAYDSFNLLGHVYKVIAFYFVYRGTVIVSLQRPNLELRASQAALTEAQHIAHLGNWELDARTRLVRWSDELLRILELGPDRDPQSLSALLENCHPEDRPRLVIAIEESLFSHKSLALESRIVNPSGAERVVHFRSRPVVDEEGRFIGLLGTAQDVTERKEAEEALRRERDLVVTITETSPFGIVRLDKVGRIVFANAAAEKALGIPRDELLRRRHDDVEWGGTDPDGAPFPNAEPPFARILRDQKSVDVNCAIRRPDGRRTLLSVRGTPLFDRAGRVDGAVVCLDDVTEHRNMEEQLRQAQKLEAVGRLAGGVAHDFNNLLTAILGCTGLLRTQGAGTNLIREGIDDIEAAANRAAILTRQLLTFSRRQVVQPKAIDLGEIVTGMDRMLRRIIGEDIELVAIPTTGLWRVKADPGQIEQVIVNLAVNARDAMPNGGRLAIETANVQLSDGQGSRHIGLKPGPYVRLSVNDTGCGMSPEIQSHLFEPFFTTKEPGKGTGLGLCTVYGIVKQAGGDIWVHSSVDEGCSVEIYLPQTTEESDRMGSTGGAAPPLQGRGVVLLVEDEALVRSLIVRSLRTAGYTVLEASDGSEALRLVDRTSAKSIDLLVTDVVMPHMGGEELARRLRAMRPDLRVLFVSGYSEHVGTFGALDGRTAFLQKPFPPAILSREVRKLLDRDGVATIVSRN